MWFQNWFRDANYSVVYAHRDEEDAENLIDLVERVTGSAPERAVLDLCCGAGRHAIALARRGYNHVCGVDLSTTLLDRAREAARTLGVEVEFDLCDMRLLPGTPKFDLVLNLFTSFGYFATDEDNTSAIAAVAGALSEEGWFVLDYFNADWLRSHLIARDERVLPDGGRLEQTRWIENGRVEKRILIRRDEEAQEFFESVRLFSLEDFERMFGQTHLRVMKTFGNYNGGPFDAKSSPRLIMFAKA